MKLRIRSMESKETTRIETPPERCTLGLLKTLIGNRVGAPPDSLHLSLNRRDELLATSPDAALQSVGLASGDLIFYSTSSFAAGSGGGAREEEVAAVPVPSNAFVDEGKPLSAVSCDAKTFCSSPKPITTAGEATGVTPDSKDMDPSILRTAVGHESDGMEQKAMDMEMGDAEEGTSITQKASPFSIPVFLKRVLDVEHGASWGDLGFLATAVHAVFLETGFVVQGTGGISHLPDGWASQNPTVSLAYTLPELIGAATATSSDGGAADSVKLKLCLLGKFVKVYGTIPGSPYKYQVCLNAPRFVPSLASSLGDISSKDEEEVFQLWKMVKDGLALRLLIDICERNGLASPPCFTRLPTDLKLMVLELLPGADLARVACVSSELRFLSSNDELWRRKFEEEFGKSEEKGLSWRRWKTRFASYLERRKRLKEMHQQRPDTYVPILPFRRPQPLPVPFPAPRFPVIGGDYDLFPSFGGLRPGSGRHIPRPMGRRIFSPNCNLGGFNM